MLGFDIFDTLRIEEPTVDLANLVQEIQITVTSV